MSGGASASSGEFSAPSLKRRLACFLYEGVLLFGVVMISGYLYSSLTQQRNAMEGRHGLAAFIFIVLAIYFTWFWSHGGQTVAMKAWHIRLVGNDGQPVSQLRALFRYLLSFLWFAPALCTLVLLGVRGGAALALVPLTGVAVYAALSWLHPQRQFLHDVALGTRLVNHQPLLAAR